MKKNVVLAAVVVAIVAAIWYIDSMKAAPGAGGGATNETVNLGLGASVASGTAANPSGGSASGALGNGAPDATLALTALAAQDKQAGDSSAIEIADPTGFINASSSFRLANLIGKKVILVDFWTYSCINCIRTIPYLNAWYGRYRDQGLEIVGIHTPEFDFEKNYANVSQAVAQDGIKYPVVLDSNYGTWTAYSNRYWPHEFLIDLAGYIVHDQIGEGNYSETEMTIQKLLAERSAILGAQIGTQTAPMPTSTVYVPQSQISGGALSPETYFGSNRNEYLGNGTPGVGGVQTFNKVATNAMTTNVLYLGGVWNIAPEYAETAQGADTIDYGYHARGVYFVAGSGTGSAIMVEVRRDGAPIPKSAAGADIFYQNGRSYVSINEKRLYRIVDDVAAADHLLEFVITAPGLEAYTFTFG